MGSGGEGPGRGGYPDLAKPQTRVTQAWRMMWTQLLVHGPTKARRAQVAVNATRAVIGRRRR